MHLSMLSPKGGGGDPGHMWGIWVSEEFLVKIPTVGHQKFGQIRSNIPTLSFVVQALVIFKRGILLVNG